MSIVRRNLMEQQGYSPYSGSMRCNSIARLIFNGEQFVCPHCGWVSAFPEDFIKEYKLK